MYNFDHADHDSSTIQDHRINLYETIKADILTGHFTPGSKLKIEVLKKRYGVGVNVIRESLTRLATEDLVDAENQKGFRVAATSSSRLSDLTRMRVLLETDGARHSFVNGTLEWESSLLAAHHKLASIEKKMLDDEETYCETWQQYDGEFHCALIAACDSQLHRQYHRRVLDQFRQFVTVDLQTNGFRGGELIDEHQAILTAALNRDFPSCVQALEKHLNFFLNRLTGM